MNFLRFSFFFVLLSMVGCNPSGVLKNCRTNTTTFKIRTVSSDFVKTKKYIIPIPKGGKINKVNPHYDKIYTEYRVKYKDGSVFYISNDILNISSINMGNLYEIGINGYTKKTMLDTAYFSGIQKNGNVWADSPIGEIVVGYSNVPIEKKDDFENAIRSVKAIQ